MCDSRQPLNGADSEPYFSRYSGLRGEYEDRPFEHDCNENTDSWNGIDWECSSCGKQVEAPGTGPLGQN